MTDHPTTEAARPEPRTDAGKAMVEWASRAVPNQIDIWRDHAVLIEREAAALPAQEPPALTEYEAWLRSNAIKEPWSFKRGTLRERLEWARVQHQLASELPKPDKPLANGAWQHWHRACAEWYAEMVRDLDAALPAQEPLDVERLRESIIKAAAFADSLNNLADLASAEYARLRDEEERP